MYNIALKFLKKNIKNDNNLLNFEYLRGKLYDQKTDLLKNSSIKVHDADRAIALVCQNYKSALTNLKKKHIKHFRIRYWSKNKKKKIIDLEKQNFSKNGIRFAILGKNTGYYDGNTYDFSKVTKDCRLIREDNEYWLYVPQNVVKENDPPNLDNVSSTDLGVTKVGTTITENKVIIIGKECAQKIRTQLERLDKITNNEKISDKIKKKNEKQINGKIKNWVDELHWKVIKYLVSTSQNILIGNLSSKSISRKGGNISKMTKRIAQRLRFYVLKERLKYKSSVHKRGYGEINEWMTSKMCSVCGNIDYDLGGNKIYKCVKCNTKMDRDVNGARNIYIKGIKK